MVIMGTKYRGTKAEIQALDVYIKLTRAASSLLDRTNRHLANYNLTSSQFGVLEALYHLGPLSQVELSRKLLLSTANITTVLQNMEKGDLVRRERDARDQRIVRVSITEKGQALVEKILPEHVSAIVADVGVLTPEEQRTLAELCRKIGLQTK